jgi:hypothetical protein
VEILARYVDKEEKIWIELIYITHVLERISQVASIAWAVENRLVLAQLATEEKSNEITAIPLLLQQLALAGCIVTIDAMGTQTKFAAQIIEQEGEYALALKENQVNLFDEVKATFALAEK